MGPTSRLVILALVAAPLLASGCDVFDDDADFQPVPFESLAGVDCLRVLEEGSEVFRDKTAWESFWIDSVVCIDGDVPTPPPEVDFATEMLVGVHWGACCSGCSSEVDAIEAIGVRDGRLEVHVGSLPSLGECTAVVEPIQVVRCSRSELPVVFFGAPGN